MTGREAYLAAEVRGLTRVNYQARGFTRLSSWLRRNFETLSHGREWWESTVYMQQPVRHGMAVLDEGGFPVLLVERRRMDCLLRRYPYVVSGSCGRMWVGSAEAARMLGIQATGARTLMRRRGLKSVPLRDRLNCKVWLRREVERLVAERQALTVQKRPTRGYVPMEALLGCGFSRTVIQRFAPRAGVRVEKVQKGPCVKYFYEPAALAKVYAFRVLMILDEVENIQRRMGELARAPGVRL